MARDYKNHGRNASNSRQAKTKPRANTRNRTKGSSNPSLSVWRWGLALLTIIVFVGFLIWLSGTDESPHGYTTVPAPIEIPEQKPKVEKPPKAAPKKEPEKVVKQEPEYTFYKYLPQKEVIIAETEIKIRKREESLGKAKPGRYVLQIGSFPNLADADRRKARLALLGIEANILQAMVSDKTWNRVRSGPYQTLTEVEKIRDILRKNNIDAVVLNQSS